MGAFPGRRVHQHDHALGPLRDPLLRRLPLPVGAFTRPARSDLVRAQAVHARCDLHLAACDPAAAPLRPADAVRLESPTAGRDPERTRYGRPGRGRPLMAVVPNTLKGFGVTLKQIFRKPITQQYPE